MKKHSLFQTLSRWKTSNGCCQGNGSVKKRGGGWSEALTQFLQALFAIFLCLILAIFRAPTLLTISTY